MKRSTVLLAIVLFAGVANLAAATNGRILLGKKTSYKKPTTTKSTTTTTATVSQSCAGNVAFDYNTWRFRVGYKAACCRQCAAGSMDRVCFNAYDNNGARYYACDSPESPAPCTNPDAPIPSKPVAPKLVATYTSDNSLPELETRDLCKSNIAFNYDAWAFRTNYKALCCAYCASGSMERVCLNAYDKSGKRYYACGADESPVPCTNPNAPIPACPGCRA